MNGEAGLAPRYAGALRRGESAEFRSLWRGELHFWSQYKMDIGIIGWIAGICAAFLVGFSKTGVPSLGILTVPMLAMVFPGKLSVGVLLPMLIVGDIVAVVRYHHDTRWSKLWKLFPFVIVGMIPGRMFLAWIDDHQFKLALGCLVLVLIAFELLRRRYQWENIPRQLWFVGTMGVLAGFATTIGNVAGPIMSVYLLSMGLYKMAFIATGAWYYFAVNLIKVPIFWNLDIITPDSLLFDVVVVPAILAGAFLGLKALPIIPQRIFETLVFVLAAASAVVLICSV